MSEYNKMPLLMDLSRKDKFGVTISDIDVPLSDLPDSKLLRDDINLPELSQLDVVRYFTNLSQMNYAIDTQFYPLGSCTMKYNPKINDQLASLKGFMNLHPLVNETFAQGALELMYNLQNYLSEISGMSATSLSTMAGAQGELAGVLMIKAFHTNNSDITNRKIMLIPDSAHGTNPASASMAGFSVKSIPSDKNGNMDIEVLKEYANENLAGIMLTLPSTLGLFDNQIVDICNIVHQSGGLVYGDGANMNAWMGQTKLGDLGFDVIHINLHKTFSTPHGGGGPGSGPVCVNNNLINYLPGPIVTKDNDFYKFEEMSNSIGSLGAFHGNFGVLVRAYCYIRTLGKEGIPEVSKNAVLNANYIMNKLKHVYDVGFSNRSICMHEVVFTANKQKQHGVKGLDIAKRLLDYGYHSPTMYFPLIVDEALMVEPTESESKATLDRFIEAMLKIAEECESNPELLHEAPITTPVQRLDEALAARQPNLKWSPKTAMLNEKEN